MTTQQDSFKRRVIRDALIDATATPGDLHFDPNVSYVDSQGNRKSARAEWIENTTETVLDALTVAELL